MSVDQTRLKLGKKPAHHDPRTLQMANYLTLPAIPPACDWTGKAASSWGMMLNDQLGDCTCAAAAHLIQAWSANAGPQEITLPDAEVLKAYEAVGHYKPGHPNTDQGAVEMDVLRYWRKHGIGGHKIRAYIGLEPKNHYHVQAAVELFGGSYIGLGLPVSAQKQKVWSVPPGGPTGTGAPGSWGGHAVIIEAYDSHGLTCITWGQKKKMTWSFWDAYCDEAYALLSDVWAPKSKQAPSGFDLAALEADLKEVTG
ncbi:MAG TPA: hypothetical protein VMU50_15890 [Polyangia bacterium]|nr:hypothetical protein [Polyangia bacterium]